MMRTKFILLVLVVVVALVGTLYWFQKRGPEPGVVQQTEAPSSKQLDAAEPSPEPSPMDEVDLVQQGADAIAVELQAPASIQPIVDLDHDPAARHRMVLELSRSLSAEEIGPLFDFLREYHPEDEGQLGHVLKNNVMDALCAQTTIPPGLDELFMGIYRDKDQNLVIRDYAVQHLSMLVERLDDPSALPEADRDPMNQRLQNYLWEATRETDTGIAGTALLGLTRLSDSDTSINTARIAEAALMLAESADANEAARMTALQVCARLQAAKALPLMVSTAHDSSSMPLRLSAIGALGVLGGRPELNLLGELAKGEDARIAHAARMAQQRIQQRAGNI